MEDQKIYKHTFQQPQKRFSPTTTKRSSWKSAERTQPQGLLWINSPSMNFSSKLPALQRSQRFKINSIYNRDDPFKPAKVLNEFNKPDLLVSQFRRSIKQVDKVYKSKEKQLQRERNDRKAYYKQLNDYLHKRNTLSKVSLKNKINTDFSQIAQIGLDLDLAWTKQKQIVQRLCPKKPKLLKMEYDKYGNRSSYFANENQSPKIQRKTQKTNLLKLNLNTRNFSFGRSQSYFTDSERFDMSRPQNFNPGPGYYFQTRKKEERKKGNHKISQSENLNDEEPTENSKHTKTNKDEIMNDSLEERQHQLDDLTKAIHGNYEDNFESESWQNQ